ncbi:MAG: alpha/beta hydrolase [Myxococcota bacterium]
MLVHNQTNLHYQVWGDGGTGDPLLCLHGGGCDGDHWKGLAEHLPHRTFIVLDQRGHGRSDAPEGEYALETFAGDAAALLHHLGQTQVVVIGHSFGGAVGMHLMKREDIAVKGLVSVDSPLLLSEAMAQGLHLMCEAFKGTDGMAFLRQFMDPIVGYEHAPARHAALLEELCAAPTHAMGSLLKHLAVFDGRPILAARSEVPLLHIDTGIDLCNLEALAELRPDAWLGTVVGTGHYPHLESPAQVAAMVAHFLERHPTP